MMRENEPPIFYDFPGNFLGKVENSDFPGKFLRKVDKWPLGPIFLEYLKVFLPGFIRKCVKNTSRNNIFVILF
jgi:hypothetical protein